MRRTRGPSIGGAVLDELFDQHYARLVRSLTVLGGDREAAADAVQEAFVQAHLRWGCVTGSCLTPTELAGVSGPLSIAGSARGFVVTVWAPPEAATVALELDGEPVGWMRPVARTARLQGEAPRDPTTQVMQRPTSLTVTIHDAEGRILEEHTEAFPLQ